MSALAEGVVARTEFRSSHDCKLSDETFVGKKDAEVGSYVAEVCPRCTIAQSALRRSTRSSG